MLKKIEITNFKNFNDKFTFDLSDTKNFEFNKESIQNGIVNTSIIYGHNGCGKSNLGLAIFDLVSQLTDKNFANKKYNNYLNANNSDIQATFKFTFKFNENIVEYEYTKKDYETLLSEQVIINDKIYASIDKNKSSIFTTSAKGAENLNKDIEDSNISIISYISKNTILKNNIENNTFKDFIEFVNNMLLYKNIDDNFYIGFKQGEARLSNYANYIVNQDYLKDFESFLNQAEIKCKLISKKVDEDHQLFFKFENKDIEFFSIASSGTRALAMFYVWQKVMANKNCKFVFIDEFDAYYHHDLSEIIIEKLKEMTDTQVILTTHNTSNISNDLLRPDCYFIMDDTKITSLKDRTHKELREAHNIEKMYRAGSFE
ncbi:MAG: ATP-binding protein [Epsilonproteobacteria bacterium]|nr:MAG: ATP-binding protein [Campylobacterota bacterium]